MAIKREFVKVDRNGTKYWLVTDKCDRCGGCGNYIKGIDYGTCFKCGGTGRMQYTEKEYTPEHEAELAEKAAKRASARARVNEEKQKEAVIANWTMQGFSSDGTGWMYYGNTYKAKETLRRGGARWNANLKAWIAPIRIECDCMMLEVKTADLCDQYGMIDWDKAYELRETLD